MNRGLVALGDSLTVGGGDAMLGVRCQSWALWLAAALELPYTCLAQNGAGAADVAREQLPRLRGPYDVGCVYVGVNDVRSVDWNADAFERALREIVAGVSEQCERMLLVSIPAELGRPPAPCAAIARANEEIAMHARTGVLLDLSGLRGFGIVQPDGVHLTAVGQAQVGLAAAELLGAEGDLAELRDAARPPGPRGRVRYACGQYALWLARDLRRRAVERAELELLRRAR